MQKWEYKTFTAAYGDLDNLGIVKKVNNQVVEDWNKKNKPVGVYLNELGEKGWELVTIAFKPYTTRVMPDPIYYLKRLKE